MKSLIWLAGGACAAVAAWIVLTPKREEPIVTLAHQLEHAWEDHHTRV